MSANRQQSLIKEHGNTSCCSSKPAEFHWASTALMPHGRQDLPVHPLAEEVQNGHIVVQKQPVVCFLMDIFYLQVQPELLIQWSLKHGSRRWWRFSPTATSSSCAHVSNLWRHRNSFQPLGTHTRSWRTAPNPSRCCPWAGTLAEFSTGHSIVTLGPLLQVMLYIHRQWNISHKKEWNTAICNLDRPRDYHTKWSKSEEDKYRMLSLICGI